MPGILPGILKRTARSPATPIAVLGVMLCMATIALFVTDLETRYRDRIAAARTDAQSFTKILAEHAVLTFEDVDRALLETVAIRKRSLTGQYPGPDAANAALRQLQTSSSVLVAIGWTDASGQLLAHSYGHTPPRPDISDMAHFAAQRDGSNEGLYISPPYRAAAGDKWFTAASRRLSGPDGSFAGIVTAPMDQSYFTKIFRSIDLGNGGSITLLHREGRILAREPEKLDAIGKSFADGPLFMDYLPRSDAGSYELTSPVDGVARVGAYKVVPGLPLVLIVTYARGEVLASWYRHLYTFGLLVSAIVVVILFGTIVLVRQTNSLAAKSRTLAQINGRFESALSNMPQGLSMFDQQKRLATWNARFAQMYGLSPTLLRVGTHVNAVAEDLVARGVIKGETGRAAIASKIAALDQIPIDTHGSRIEELSDGRLIRISRQPMKEGGWVATHEDITEQKRSAQLLADTASEIEAMNLRFNAALENMSQGLCMFDAGQQVVVSNARYGEIYHLSRDQIKPGTSLAQILEYRREKGTGFAGVAPEAYLSKNVKEKSEVRELVDGRVVAIARHMMPNGGWLTTHEDITDRARGEQRVAFMAQHDLLTGLANRALFSEKIDDAARRLKRHGTNFSVLMLDLDRFKNVNDTLGHPAGDQLLREVAQRLKSSLRDTDVVARLGGDEFAIIQENEKNQSEGAIALALKIIGLIEQPFQIAGHQVGVGTSIGIAFAPDHGADASVLMQRADLALYAAKAGGRNDFRVFQLELTEAADQHKSMENELREAIARNEFELHYQPVIDARTRLVSGVEAFVRWHHPSRGMLTPDQFLPLAESTGLMSPLGEWILRQACLDAAAWPPHIRIAVNLSAAQFDKGNLFDIILCVLVESGLSPERLELEIPDAALLERNQATHLAVIRQLKNLGISIVLDNCGGGYSAASYLTGFPFDKVKIDRPIAQGFANRRDCGAVVASVLALARGLDIATAAKGVESREQFEALLAAGVGFAQGYLFGRPVPYDELDLDLVFPMTRNVA